jgi:O-acetyl-ADP-ribose deacetylase
MPSPPLPLSDIPNLTLLYKLHHIDPSEAQQKRSRNSDFNDIVSLIRHDITALQVSAIVNAANKSLLGGGGVDGAIHRRAGPRLFAECKALDGCETGFAKMTRAYELPCDKVIHTVGPIYDLERRRGADRPERLLRGCYETSLRLAVENGCKSIAFPCVSAGVYGYPSHEAAKVALTVVREWLDQGKGDFERIIFCCFETKDENAYRSLIP